MQTQRQKQATCGDKSHIMMEVETGVTQSQAEEVPEVPEVGGGKEGLSPNGFVLLNHWPPGRAGQRSVVLSNPVYHSSKSHFSFLSCVSDSPRPAEHA